MPATGPDISRRLFLLLLAAPLARADEVFDIFTRLASALSEGNPIDFMTPFDPAMPGYNDLRAYVTALAAGADLSSSVAVLDDTGDQHARDVELDWLLEIKLKQPSGGLERRHERVRCRLQRRGKRWRIISLSPLTFFAPPPPARF